MKNAFLFIILSSVFSACAAKKTEIQPTVIYSACSLDQEQSGICSRFMDRNIYFVNGPSGVGLSVKNSPLDIVKIQSSLREFACLTELGCNYFIFNADTEANLTPITEYTTGVNFKSFIQVWPDAEFSELYNKVIPNPSEPNAIVFLNPNNRKQFYMILKGSCFSESGNVNCTNNEEAIFTSDLGLSALLARNLGRLVGIPLDYSSQCSSSPASTNVMCGSYPNNSQWSTSAKNSMTSLFNNALETIALNLEYYREIYLE